MSDLVPLVETLDWTPAIHEAQDGYRLNGGPPNLAEDTGLFNVQPKQLANRTLFLRALASNALRTVVARQDAPPPAPATAAAWLVGAAPTGAWAGQAHRTAIWLGASWHFVVPTTGRLAIDEAGTIWRYSGAAWSAWSAGTALAGPVELATIDETLAFTDSSRAITPAGLGAALAALKSGNGRVRVGDILLQWGFGNYDQAEQSSQVFFPVSFASANYRVFLTDYAQDAIDSGNAHVVSKVNLGSPSASFFRVYAHNLAGNRQSTAFEWFAIGDA